MKGVGAIVVVIGVVFISLFAYLIYKTWDVFGFWNMLWTGMVNLFSGLFLFRLAKARSESNGKITYNPKEWPKFIQIAVYASTGYFLFTIISVPKIDKYDYYFGLTYLILLSALPILRAVFTLIRDRNDFVEIEADYISYKDNSETGRFEIATIKSLETAMGYKSITLHFNDETSHVIMLSQMNFTPSDTISLVQEIKSRIPAVEEEDLSYDS
jgi:hypothetical protein